MCTVISLVDQSQNHTKPYQYPLVTKKKKKKKIIQNRGKIVFPCSFHFSKEKQCLIMDVVLPILLSFLQRMLRDGGKRKSEQLPCAKRLRSRPSTSMFLHCIFLAKDEELIRKRKNIFRVNELSCIPEKRSNWSWILTSATSVVHFGCRCCQI